jgi:glycosyltransferase A (GT-A) superfamily protein (DUF2064 family)
VSSGTGFGADIAAPACTYDPDGATLVVIAKTPAAGRSKTRLCPPCTPAEAAALAEAALRDTLAAVAATPAARRVVALDGDSGEWLPPGFEVIAQRGEGLAERLAAAFEDVGGPALLVAMDTPQVTPEQLGEGLASVTSGGFDAALGATADHGYWGIGLRCPDRAAFKGVPMSSPRTHAAQLARLEALGLDVAALGLLRDVDTIADARVVARAAPRSRFAAALDALALDTPALAEA